MQRWFTENYSVDNVTQADKRNWNKIKDSKLWVFQLSPQGRYMTSSDVTLNHWISKKTVEFGISFDFLSLLLVQASSLMLSIQWSLGLPWFLFPLNLACSTLCGIWSNSILSTGPNHWRFQWSSGWSIIIFDDWVDDNCVDINNLNSSHWPLDHQSLACSSISYSFIVCSIICDSIDH